MAVTDTDSARPPATPDGDPVIPQGPLSLAEFDRILDRTGLKHDFMARQGEGVALAFSGGGDSIALAWLLSGWMAHFAHRPVPVHALTVDHGLRPESGEEARAAGQAVAGLDHIRHTILRWEGDKPETGVQAAARQARFALMDEYCRTHGIEGVFLAHHRDDQVETFLHRLARGSGVDGLACMPWRKTREDAPDLVRPLLDIGHDRLIATCRAEGLSWVEDPTNTDTRFTRPRLRRAMSVLEEEGLSPQRLAKAAARMARARQALDYYADRAWQDCVSREDDGISIEMAYLRTMPEEIALRLLQRAVAVLGPGRDYPVRMEKLESLLERIRDNSGFTGATLGGCRFDMIRNGTEIEIKAERAR